MMLALMIGHHWQVKVPSQTTMVEKVVKKCGNDEASENLAKLQSAWDRTTVIQMSFGFVVATSGVMTTTKLMKKRRFNKS